MNERTLVKVAMIWIIALGVDALAEEKRVAIVMGNGAYQHVTSLPNPRNDAEKVSAALQTLEFDVHTLLDTTKEDLERAIGKIPRWVRRADVTLFFYAGHGIQVNGQNYLVPVDAQFSGDSRLADQLVGVERVLDSVVSGAATNLVFLDACRNNPMVDVIDSSLSGGRAIRLDAQSKVEAVGRGLAEMKATVGTLIAYATQPGNVAEDGEGDNSPFTTALLSNILNPGQEIRQILTKVRVDVIAATGSRQVPWDHSSLTADYYFIPKVSPRDLPMPPP